MPIYSEDRQEIDGIPDKAILFKRYISGSDGIILSLAEHNGSYTAAFKNIYDWISVIENDVWSSKPILLLSTSTGARGGKTILESAHKRFSLDYKYSIPSFCLPNFYDNFSETDGIKNSSLNEEFKFVLSEFQSILDDN